MKGNKPPLKPRKRTPLVPTEPPVFTELERLGLVIPISQKRRAAPNVRKKAR
jgi:hypothetical protein